MGKDPEQRLASSNALPRGVDVEFLDPTCDPRVNVRNAPFIGDHGGDGAKRLAQQLLANTLNAHADGAESCWVELDAGPCRCPRPRTRVHCRCGDLAGK